MTDTKHIRGLLAEYEVAQIRALPCYAEDVAAKIIAEIPALLDKADKYDALVCDRREHTANCSSNKFDCLAGDWADCDCTEQSDASF